MGKSGRIEIREIFRINVELNFAFNLLIGFLKKCSKIIDGQILNFPGEILEFGPTTISKSGFGQGLTPLP